MNYATVWASVKRQFAILVVTNTGNETASRACDQVTTMLVTKFTPGS